MLEEYYSNIWKIQFIAGSETEAPNEEIKKYA